MRGVVLPVLLFFCGLCYGQGSGFTFSYTGPTQIIVGPDCIAELDWGHPNTPTATSNIPGGSIVSFNIYSISGGYEIGDDVGGGTVVTVFYQAIDNFGNSALFGFSIAFIDLIPPAFDPLSLPANMTVNCTGNFPVADVEITDNCQDQDIVLTLTFTETNNALPCTGGVITRTWVADDDLGNMATFVQTITVLPDNTPPVIANNLVNGMAPCSTAMAQYSSWLTAQRAAFSATDAGCGVMTLSDNAPSPATITSFCGVVTVTFSAKDNCNNISTVQKTFTITNNVPPVITTPASGASGNCSQPNINQVFNNWINTHGGAVATDDCSGIVWSTFPATPSLSDTCDAVINVMFIAGDGCGNADTTSAGFTITDDTPPTVSVQPTTMILSCSSSTVDSLLMDWLMDSGHSEAHDLCTSDNNLVPGYRISGIELTLQQVLDAWQDSLAAGCNDNVVINGVGINNVKGYIPVQFTYDDACDNEVGATGYFGVTDNGRPQFTVPPTDTSFVCQENEAWEDAFLVWYNNAGGAVYTDACSNVSVNASITADSAIVYLTTALDTACSAGAIVTIQFSLTDDCGNMSMTSPSASFSLQDTIAPVIVTPPSDYNATCAMDGQVQLNNWLDTLGGAVATDGCGNLTWVFSWVDTSGATLNGVPNGGPYPVLNTLDCAGGLDVTFTVTDICDNSTSATATFSRIDTIPPVILIDEDSIHLTCLDTIPLDTPQVSDDCNGQVIITYQDINSTESCNGHPEIVVRTWTASDECGNETTATVTYFRIDSMPPTFELPSDSVEFCSVDTLMLIELADNCDPSPISSFVDVVTGSICHQTLERTWTVSDACGNTASATQTFDLSDFAPPVIQYSPGHFVYTCSIGNVQDEYEQWMDSVVVADGCSDVGYFIALPGTYVLADTSTWPGTPLPDSIILTCDAEINIVGDLVAFDICGNAVVEQISFSVNDTVAPIINCPAVIVVEPDTTTCTGLVHLTAPAIDELCFPNNVSLGLIINGGDTITLDSTGVLDTIMDVGVHTALWIASDCKGNTSRCETSIEIIDENAISLTCPSDTILFATDSTCSESLWVYPPFTTEGLCAKGVVVLRFEIIGNAVPDSMVFESPTDSVLVNFMEGFNQVLLIARDSTGDIDTCKYFVELRDTIAPEVICQNDTIFLHPSGVDSFDVSTASLIAFANDNCSIQNVTYNPATVTCDSAGQAVDIMVVVFDGYGNTDTCVSELFISTLPLLPQWQIGLCDDTLRLFANIPPGPDATYVFNWSGPNGFVSNEENPVIPDADSLNSGTYFLTIQSENGCVSTGSVEVDIETLAASILTIEDDTVCTGQTITIATQDYAGNITYQWFQITPNGDTLSINTVIPTIIFSPVLPGTYTFFAVVIQDTCASEPGPDVFLYAVETPQSDISDLQFPLCEYDTLFLAPAFFVDSLLYTWAGPGGFVSNDAFPAGIPVSTLDSPAVFFLRVANQFCTSEPDSIEIIIQTSPTVPEISGDDIICEGGPFVLTASPLADQFLWIDPAENTFLTQDNTLEIAAATINHSGAWRVFAIENGCRSDTSAAFIIQVDSAIDVQIVTMEIVCDGDSISLTTTPSPSGTYTWGGPGGFASDEISPTTLAVEGTYFVFVETETGCEAMDSTFVVVDISPSIIELSTDADSCANGTDDINLSAIVNPVDDGSFVYNWSGPGGFISQDSSPVIQDFNASLNGTYTLYITSGVCTTDTASLIIDVTDNPSAPVITGDNVYCFGDTILLGIDSPIAGALYTWSSTDTTVSVPSPGVLIIPDVDQSWTGIYHVEVTIDGCTSSQSNIAIQVKSELAPPVISHPALVCEGDDLVLTTDAPAGSTVTWFGPNAFTTVGATAVISPVSPANAGLYSAFYVSNGCASDTSVPVLINVQSTIASPSILTDVGSICIDNPAPLTLCLNQGTLTPGAQYTWVLNNTIIITGPDNDSCIIIQGDPLQGGANNITVIATLQGCVSDTSASIIITGDEFPTQAADAGIDMQYCPGELIELDATNPSPATGVWSDFEGVVVFNDITDPGTIIDPLPPGEYELTWTLSFESCLDYSSDEVLITIVPSPVIVPDTFDVPFGQTAEFIVTTNDTLSGLPFILTLVQGTQKGNVLHAGNGIFRYTPNLGFVGTDMMIYRICSVDCPEECGEVTVILHVGSEDDCFIPTLFTPNDDGVNDILIIPCLETDKFPTNKIIVFNEWGDAVYTASPYLNDWDGRYSGDPLPVGTYFYIMDFGDGSEPERSFLVIER